MLDSQHIIQNNLRVFLLLFFAGFAIYANVIPGKFLFDDNLFIENNEQIKSLSNIPELYFSSVTGGSSVKADNFYRPNQQAVNALLYAAFGLDPVPFHILSILFHIVNSFLIFILFLELGIGRNGSFFSSLVFLIHPINTQAVSYISGMADPMGLMFVLASLLFFLKNFKTVRISANQAPSGLQGNVFRTSDQRVLRTGKSENQGAKSNTGNVPVSRFHTIAPVFFSILFFIAAIFTKENTIVFPALAFISFIFLSGKPSSLKSFLRENKSIILLLGIYFSIAGLYLYFKFTALNFAGTHGLTDQKNIYTENLHIRLITFLNILPEYFKMMLFPLRLNYEKPYTAFVDFQRAEGLSGMLLFVLGSGIAIYHLYKKFKMPAPSGKAPGTSARKGAEGFFFFSFAWFFICLAPVSGIIPVNAMYLEHWLYYPVIGVIFYGAKTYERQKNFIKNIFFFLIILLCLAFSARTVWRNSEWADGIKFYKNELKYADRSARMHNNLAMIYADEKKCPLAIQHYKKAIALYDVYPQTHHNLARCYEATGNINGAVNEYVNALLLYPDFIHSHRCLFNIFQSAGDTAHAAIFKNFLSRLQKGETINPEEITGAINSLKK